MDRTKYSMSSILSLVSVWILLTVVGLNAKDIPKLLLISLDGFRWDYLNRGYHTPHINFLATEGTRIKSIRNAYITKTFPNHFTIVTGLHEESHGLVANYMYDPMFNETFNAPSKHTIKEMKRWFDSGHVEPVWTTNQKGRGHSSGSVMWPTSEAWTEIESTPYNRSMPFKSRINIAVDWLKSKNFVALYFEEPDETGHRAGPDSPAIRTVIEKLDDDIWYLIKELKKADLFDKVNVILTSDHGMANTNKDRTINLDDYVDSSSYLGVNNGMVMFIFPHTKEETEEIYKNLTIQKISHIKVWKKEHIPSQYHYQHNRRIPPILVQADEGWVIERNASRYYIQKGDHGYNNTLLDMHPIFVARGPVFKKGVYIDDSSIENVDIYPLMCHILDVKAASNNGSLKRIRRILQTNNDVNDNSLLIAAVMIALTVVILVIVGIVWYAKKAIKARYEFVGWDDEINAETQEIPFSTHKERYTLFVNETRNERV